MHHSTAAGRAIQRRPVRHHCAGFSLRDVFYFVECLDNNDPLAGSSPGCRWADIDGDTDTDLRDFSKLQNSYTAAP